MHALLGLEAGGADIIELGMSKDLNYERADCFVFVVGVPFSDPIADGPTIQESSYIALKNGIDIKKCLQFVSDARAKGWLFLLP